MKYEQLPRDEPASRTKENDRNQMPPPPPPPLVTLPTGSSMMPLDSSSISSRQSFLTPQEEALQSLCKQLLKTRLFRGFYLERRHVESLNEYRDIVSLQRSERDLEKMLLDICKKLQMFYAYSSTPTMWIGVTHGPHAGMTEEADALETYLWIELDELAFGQYWFSIKTIRFRENEILLKLKVVRPITDEDLIVTPNRRRSVRLNAEVASNNSKPIPKIMGAIIQQSNVQRDPIGATSSEPATAATTTTTEHSSENQERSNANFTPNTNSEPSNDANENFNVQLQDFIELMYEWGNSIKITIYDFLSNDINKHNIKEVLRFLLLLLFSLLTGAAAATKFLGVFVLRLMFEFSRFTHVSTPIILKLIDICGKIVGGFYILLSMIWRDTFGKGSKVIPDQPSRFQAIDYNRPLYRAIQDDVRLRRRHQE